MSMWLFNPSNRKNSETLFCKYLALDSISFLSITVHITASCWLRGMSFFGRPPLLLIWFRFVDKLPVYRILITHKSFIKFFLNAPHEKSQQVSTKEKHSWL